jgi:hypothetical protein
MFVLFSAKYFLFNNLSISVNIFCINHVLKFKYPPQGIKVKLSAMKALERLEVKLRIV